MPVKFKAQNKDRFDTLHRGKGESCPDKECKKPKSHNYEKQCSHHLEGKRVMDLHIYVSMYRTVTTKDSSRLNIGAKFNPLVV